MAEENISKQEFHIRNLPTRSVTLYPSRALIVRDIKEITLKPGPNEITIYGLTPTVDENSIKVDGAGSATITDMAVDLVPNPDSFQEIYPSDSEDDEDELDRNAPEAETDAIKDIDQKLNDIFSKQAKEREALESFSNQLKLLEAFLNKIKDPKLEDITSTIDIYDSNRRKFYDGSAVAKKNLTELSQTERELIAEKHKLATAEAKEAAKRKKQEQKEWVKKERARFVENRTKQRLKDVRVKFWPRKVYRIVLNIDTNSLLTPLSSRRGSVESLGKPAAALPDSISDSTLDPCRISLCLSYITTFASWSPRYDLSITTPSKTGSLVYRAELRNLTSETWKDAKLVLSTSQTSFHGLAEPIPEMKAWHVRLQSHGSFRGSHTLPYSLQEQQWIQTKQQVGAAGSKPSKVMYPDHLFGVDQEHRHGAFQNPVGGFQPQQNLQQAQPPPANPFGQPAPSVPANPAASSSLFGGSDGAPQRSGGLFGPLPGTSQRSGGLFSAFGAPQRPEEQTAIPAHSSLAVVAPRTAISTSSSLFGSSSNPANPTPGPTHPNSLSGDLFKALQRGEPLDSINDDTTLTLAQTAVDPQEPAWESSGLTATYDVPGLRTIFPSDTNRRHKIATIDLKDIQLSYVCVPKLRAAAFLKARITNHSGASLLKGPAGLTLDGSFLGNTEIPRCSAGETFSLPLGVDPSITVTYGRPGVKKNLGSGVFSKEESTVYSRTATLTNTKTVGGPVEVVVTDQIPVSEDEKLKLDILIPKGLKGEGDQAKTGQGVDVHGNKGAIGSTRGSVYSLDGVRGAVGKDEKWGKAIATVKKAGEIEWNVKLNPGLGVRLELEFEARFPAGDIMVNGS